MSIGKKWMFSIGENEVWDGEQFESKEQAIKKGVEYYLSNIQACEGMILFVGLIEEFYPVLSANVVIDSIRETAVDFCGDIAKDYISVSDIELDDLEQKLNQVFREWLKDSSVGCVAKISNEEIIDVSRYMDVKL